MKQAQHVSIFVIFGIPGSGKSTVADRVLALLSSHWQSLQSEPQPRPIALDLDSCVPEWMRENFARGIYPTLKQRGEFVASCCDYVVKSLSDTAKQHPDTHTVAIVSFSFVNRDLRDGFRNRFPNSQWILMQTSEEEAQRRIESRAGHFYKGKTSSRHQTPTDTSTNDNTDWDFAPVTFPHAILDGMKPVDENAAQVVQMIRKGSARVLWIHSNPEPSR
jgi:gluconate kinase